MGGKPVTDCGSVNNVDTVSGGSHDLAARGTADNRASSPRTTSELCKASRSGWRPYGRLLMTLFICTIASIVYLFIIFFNYKVGANGVFVCLRFFSPRPSLSPIHPCFETDWHLTGSVDSYEVFDLSVCVKNKPSRVYPCIWFCYRPCACERNTTCRVSRARVNKRWVLLHSVDVQHKSVKLLVMPVKLPRWLFVLLLSVCW